MDFGGKSKKLNQYSESREGIGKEFLIPIHKSNKANARLESFFRRIKEQKFETIQEKYGQIVKSIKMVEQELAEKRKKAIWMINRISYVST